MVWLLGLCYSGAMLQSIVKWMTHRSPEDYLWHRVALMPLFARLTDGKRQNQVGGQIWRRRNTVTHRWEYKQDEETYQEWCARQW